MVTPASGLSTQDPLQHAKDGSRKGSEMVLLVLCMLYFCFVMLNSVI
jgi:hypothetical protein